MARIELLNRLTVSINQTNLAELLQQPFIYHIQRPVPHGQLVHDRRGRDQELKNVFYSLASFQHKVFIIFWDVPFRILQ